MIDLHTHTIFSDGELVPAEMARRAEFAGYRAIALTDHVDHSNLNFVVPRIVSVCHQLSRASSITVIPGAEITHVPPELIHDIVVEARSLGARIIVVHGETIVEPVASGTNRAALLSPVDILAHPGLITVEEARLAAERSIFLEISTRKGHSLTNGHVAMMARESGAKLLINNDAHAPTDLVSPEQAFRIARGSGMTDTEIDRMIANAEEVVEKLRV